MISRRFATYLPRSNSKRLHSTGLRISRMDTSISLEIEDCYDTVAVLERSVIFVLKASAVVPVHDLLRRYFYPLLSIARRGLTNRTVGGIITSFIHRGWRAAVSRPGLSTASQNNMAIK